MEQRLWSWPPVPGASLMPGLVKPQQEGSMSAQEEAERARHHPMAKYQHPSMHLHEELDRAKQLTEKKILPLQTSAP